MSPPESPCYPIWVLRSFIILAFVHWIMYLYSFFVCVKVRARYQLLKELLKKKENKGKKTPTGGQTTGTGEQP
ncbi:unnamed protein product [Caenorhabditis brenneri]